MQGCNNSVTQISDMHLKLLKAERTWSLLHWRAAISRHLSAKFSSLDAEILLKFTYSGMVLAAEATLSLDSFFFIALEAIFANISRIFKNKSLLFVKAKLCCHVNR